MSATAVTVVGLGEMGRALAARLLEEGYPTTVWNRSPGRAEALVAAGAREANSFHGAVTSSRLSIVCVRDYANARASLEREAPVLAGRSIVNLTTGTPDEARAMADWAADHGIGYLDGGIMAIPSMIGTPAASLLYSGDADVYRNHREALGLLGSAQYLGDDAGMAALQDLAMLAAMYAMFAGAYQAYAMVGSAGVKAAEFADTLQSWLRAMAGSLPRAAELIDSSEYATDVQDLVFTRTAVGTIVQAGEDAGVRPGVLSAVATMLDEQIAAGHGDQHATRMIESIRTQ
ncbi:NAD(P)-binding domain-containing protein [Nocardioidaceae bacterium SCSIO 66511]|nr:NAD(P)-binding domain-containing protein [Nocardioidaceae bacterium SCSIO 66511]